MVSIENEFRRGLLKQFFTCLGKVIFHCPFFMSIYLNVQLTDSVLSNVHVCKSDIMSDITRFV